MASFQALHRHHHETQQLPQPLAQQPPRPPQKQFALHQLLTPSRIASQFNLFRMAVTTSAMRTMSASTESQATSNGTGDDMSDAFATDFSDHSSDDSVIQELKTRAKTSRRSPAKAKATPKKSASAKKATPPATTKRRSSVHNYAPSTSSGHSTPRSTSGRKSTATGSPHGRVGSGRVTKTYKSKQSSPRAKDRRRKSADDEEDELVSELNQQVQISEAKAEEEMELEKLFYPGSDQWAPDENRLFEALYLRQYRPLVPSSWTFDFRGIPAPDAVFANSDEHKPLIYSCSGHDSQASRALIRLIQLSGTVRALVQSGNQAKCAAAIRAELYRYANWAAKDGGFDRYNVLPTFLLEIADTSVNGGEITRYMQTRMLALAKAHRDFLRLDEDEAVLQSVENGADASTPPPLPRYHRRPPVLYGLFIIHTVVIILTVDSAKEPEAAEVSYHVEVNFNSPYQGLWNAFTVAIPVCMARDDMMQRKDDYELCLPQSESDPDA